MRQPVSSENVRSARQRFFEAGQSPRGLVSETIIESWRRCRASGLATGQRLDVGPLERAAFEMLRQQYEDLRRLCRPEIEALYGDAKATGSMVILTAPTGLILDALGNAEFLDKAARVALRPGVTWNEEHTGTNAIGTALHEHRAVEVRGAEHYFGAHRMLSCSASPILDGRGRTVGVLDLSGEASVHHVHALGMVRFAVDQIERRMLERELAGREVIRLHPDAALLGTHREGVLVFEEHKLVAANRYALEMLGVDWSEIGRCRYDLLFDSAVPRGSRAQPLRSTSGVEFQARRDLVPSHLVKAPRARGALPVRELAPVFDAGLDAELQRGVRLLEADIPILLQGETGTGKEVAARELHRRSNRAGGPFIAVNCAALPENLIEAELFGYRPGAFTGARREGAHGLLRDADGGVLFLDEIGDMPLVLQSRLLRVLQEREVAPLGGGKAVTVDFVVIAATHRDLDDDVAAQRFRPDLFYRIAQARVRLKALREHESRGELILELWRALGGEAADMKLGALTLARLAAFDWPGNMRQLLGVLRALMALGDAGATIGVDALPAEVRDARVPLPAPACRDGPDLSPLGKLERDAMQAALRACAGNVSEAARRLGVSRSTLYRRLGSAPTHAR
jgi:sigma-54 dependent transcriptional regulator, acetoin dehydrogenase operon transcriptional activator AcoR